MANRILRDWTCSDNIDLLSESAEVFLVRLIMKADDFGRFYGSPKILKAQLFPLKDYAFKNIEKWRNEVVKSGVISLYVVDGKEYLEIKNFGQRLRLMKSKFPEPPSNDSHLTVKRHTNDGLKRKETNIETEEEDETEKNEKNKIPTIEEFLDYAQSVKEFSNAFESLVYSITSKYEQWVANGWKDGHNSPIKNWKTKLKNTLPHLKPLNNLNNGIKQQQLTEIGSQLRQIDPRI